MRTKLRLCRYQLHYLSSPLTPFFNLPGQLCGIGKFLKQDCSSGSYSSFLPTPGRVWQIDIDTTYGKVLWWETTGYTNYGRQASISDFSNMYHIVMVFGGGTFDLNIDNSFLKTKYDSDYVTFPTSTRVNVANGATTRIIGEKITTTSVTSYQLTFTSYGADMCFGLISTSDVDSVTLNGGDFNAHWGVCVAGATSQLTTVCPCGNCISTGCTTCVGAGWSDCTSCKPEFYLSDCSGSCHAYCSVCTGPSNTECSACKSGYFLQPASTTCDSNCPSTAHWKDTINNICVNSCPIGYYEGSTSDECMPCHAACSKCEDGTHTFCLACNEGYFLQPSSTICLDTCPSPGYWQDTTNHICADCNAACSICTGSSNTQCSACKPGYFLQPTPDDTTCLSTCPVGYWQDTDNHICASCDVACAACTSSASTQCSACKTGFFLRPTGTGCQNSCPSPGYWQDTTNHICAGCHTACSVCTGSSNTQCSACKSGYFLQPAPDDTTCLSTCPVGYWKDNTDHICALCDTSCAECLGGTNNQCSSCNDGYFLQPSSTTCLSNCPSGKWKDTANNICVDSCPSPGYWQDTTNHICADCHTACSVCTGSSNTQCSACKPGYFLQPAPDVTTCLSTCPVGYWKDDTNNKCMPCNVACAVCTGSASTQCSACKTGFFLQPSGTECLNSCPSPGYWQDTTNHICADCHTACSVCTGSSDTQCSTCKSGYFLQPAPDDTTCSSTCPVGYWQDTDNHICASCNAACAACTGSASTQCSACKSGYFLQPSSTICLDSCSLTGYWQDTTNHICAPCNVACAACTGSANTQCSSCKTGYFLQPSGTECLDTCPAGYWSNPGSNSCDTCNAACAICTGPSDTQCSACESGHFLQPSPAVTTCSSSCPLGFWEDTTNHICVPCNVACVLCSDGTHTQCTACSPGYFLQPSPSTVCLNACPDGYWGNSGSNSCDACNAACAICTGPSDTQCSACNSGYFLQPSSTTCLDSCPIGYWGNTTSNLCLNCDASCATCTGPDNTQCSACKPGFYPDSSLNACKSKSDFSLVCC